MIRRVTDDASPAFDNDSLGGGTGWMNQNGGFDGLSSEDQEEARQAQQQERNEEVANFVKKAVWPN